MKDKIAEQEKIIIRKRMIIYCRKNHRSKTLCSDCRELLDYSKNRIKNCRWIDNKPNCSDCSTNCFSREKRDQLRKIMRFSGPRLIFQNPAACIIYLKKKLFIRRIIKK